MSTTTPLGSSQQEPARGTRIAGGVVWIISTVLYFVAQGYVASAWSRPRFSWTANYISDLGNTKCGLFSVPHGSKYLVCSPRHTTMNVTFILVGILVIAGALLLRRFWPAGRRATWATTLFVISGVGKVIVGLVPENTRIGLHLIGALNVPIMAVGMILVSLSFIARDRSLAIVGILLAGISLLGFVLSTAGEFSHHFYLGFGVGGMERISDYPTNLWLLLLGVIVIASPSLVDRAPTSPTVDLADQTTAGSARLTR
jgi:hypothetical membrane protein